MFQLIKGVGKKAITWITLTIIVTLLTITFILFKDNQKVYKENGAVGLENGIMKQNDDYRQKSIAISDKTVSDLVVNRQEAKQKTEQLRREAKNEYSKQISTPQKDEEPDGAARVRVLARSMHDNFCRARPEDTRCHTNNTNP